MGVAPVRTGGALDTGLAPDTGNHGGHEDASRAQLSQWALHPLGVTVTIRVHGSGGCVNRRRTCEGDAKVWER